jgi:hypothetical protein
MNEQNAMDVDKKRRSNVDDAVQRVIDTHIRTPVKHDENLFSSTRFNVGFIHGQGVRTITILRGWMHKILRQNFQYYIFFRFGDLFFFFGQQRKIRTITRRAILRSKIFPNFARSPSNFCQFARSPPLISPICDVGWVGLSGPLPMYGWVRNQRNEKETQKPMMSAQRKRL